MRMWILITSTRIQLTGVLDSETSPHDFVVAIDSRAYYNCTKNFTFSAPFIPTVDLVTFLRNKYVTVEGVKIGSGI